MKFINNYKKVRNKYISQSERDLIKMVERWVLLCNPIIISILIVPIVVYRFSMFNELIGEYEIKLYTAIVNVAIGESIIVYLINRIRFMNKTKWNNTVSSAKNKFAFKGDMSKEEGKFALNRVNVSLLKSFFIYYILGILMSGVIVYKTGESKIIAVPIGGSDVSYKVGIIILCIIMTILLLLRTFRKFFFEKSFELITYNLEKGDIEGARKIVNSETNNLRLWGQGYIIAFRQVNDLINVLEKKGREADNKTKERIELITNASHDIKTPLTSIISYSKILQENNLTELEIEEYKEILVSKAKRLSNLMHELKEAGKSDDEQIRMKIEKCNIKKVINNILDNNKERLNQKGLEVICNNFNDEVVCNIDITKTERVLENLISNIYKYSKQGSKVKIDLKETESGCKIILQNESEKEITESAENLLKRFTRGDKSRNTEGYGLGLNIAKRFMEEQDGELELYIEEKSFKVILTFSVG